MSIQLKANKWKKVASWYGTNSKKIRIDVATSEQCQWRRKTAWVTTGSGKFTDKKDVGLFNSLVDVKSPVDTTCTSSFI